MIVLRNAMLVVVLVLSVVLALASGCAAMYNPNPQAVPVDSVPVGASVFAAGAFMGVTPLILDLDNRRRRRSPCGCLTGASGRRCSSGASMAPRSR